MTAADPEPDDTDDDDGPWCGTWAESCDPGAEWHDQTVPPFRLDLCGQGASAEQIHRMTDIQPIGDYL